VTTEEQPAQIHANAVVKYDFILPRVLVLKRTQRIVEAVRRKHKLQTGSLYKELDRCTAKLALHIVFEVTLYFTFYVLLILTRLFVTCGV
jgi:hypothetical protein